MKDIKIGTILDLICISCNALKLPIVFHFHNLILIEAVKPEIEDSSCLIEFIILLNRLKVLRKHFSKAWEMMLAVTLLAKEIMLMLLPKTIPPRLKSKWLHTVAMPNVSKIAPEIQEWSQDAPNANAQDRSLSKSIRKMLEPFLDNSSIENLFIQILHFLTNHSSLLNKKLSQQVF